MELMGSNTAKWNKEMTMQDHVFEDRAGQNEARREQEQWVIIKSWLKGHSVKDIALEMGHQGAYILQCLKEARQVILTWHEDEIELLAAERIEGFRLIQKSAWDIQESHPRQATQLLAVISRAEENIAKIQGVLSDKNQSITRTTRTIKSYTFNDGFPDRYEELQEIEEQTTPALREPIEVLPRRSNVLILDGEIIESEPHVIKVPKAGVS